MPVDVKRNLAQNQRQLVRKMNVIHKNREKTGKAMIDRDSAWGLLTEFTQSESLRKHALAVEACMRACARKFSRGSTEARSSEACSGEEEVWGVVGLIHDFDYEKYPSRDDHPYRGNEILQERGWPENIRRAVISHAEYTGVTRDTPMEKALFACDELAGFITAVALVKPGRSLAEVDAKSVRKKMKDKAFARSVNRNDIINGAADLGVDLEQHIASCIEAMKGIAAGLGLDGSAARATQR
jgi:predicted hydrolase (HD superfamily)